MQGQPLAEALRCAHVVVDRMRPIDTVALVSFDDKVRRLWPAVPIGDGKAVHAAIDTIRAGGSTNLHGGWLEAVEALSSVAGDGIRRVILLSDGQANHGVTDAADIAAQCATQAARGITTSTFGLSDHFNEDLMVAMARAGNGNHYYGDTAEDLMEPFEQELALLGNLYLRNLRLRVDAEPGVSVQMINALRTMPDGWVLPDLAWGAEAWAVVRLTVDARGQGTPDLGATNRTATSTPGEGRSRHLARIAVSGEGLGGSSGGGSASEPASPGQGCTLSAELVLPVLPAADHGALPVDELVSRRLAELQAAVMMRQMRDAATAGDWAAVDALLASAQQQFAGNAWVQAMLQSMQEIAASRQQARIAKEALYASERLNKRLAPSIEHMSMDAMTSAQVPAYLRRKRSQGKG